MSDTKIEGIIRAGESYTLPEFQRRTGLGDYALHQARRDGLPVRTAGRKRFILGEDWLDYLKRPNVAENGVSKN